MLWTFSDYPQRSLHVANGRLPLAMEGPLRRPGPIPSPPSIEPLGLQMALHGRTPPPSHRSSPSFSPDSAPEAPRPAAAVSAASCIDPETTGSRRGGEGEKQMSRDFPSRPGHVKTPRRGGSLGPRLLWRPKRLCLGPARKESRPKVF